MATSTEQTYTIPTDTLNQTDTPRGTGGTIDRNTSSTSITSTALAPSPSFNLTPPKPATQATGMLGYLDAYAQQTQSKASQDKAAYSDSLDTYMKAALSSDTEGGFLEQIKADTGVQSLKEEDTAIATDIRNEQYALTKRIEALRKNPQGMFGGALDDAINEVETESLSKQADMYIKQLAIHGKYQDALDFATNAAKAIFEKQEKRNEALKFNVEQHKDLFSASELRAFNQMQGDRDRELATQKQMKLETWRQKIEQENMRLQSNLTQSNARYSNSLTAGGGAGTGADAPLYSGLNSATATAVRAQVNAFKSEPVVQNFAVIQEGRNFAGSLSDTTTNPVDDQALIYSLAKALDPGSVVREGEYATAQKYAQSWISAYGKGVTQAIAGTGFLTEKARRQIKDTIEAKYKASLSSYDNLHNQYISGVNNLTGRDDGSKFLRNYNSSAGAAPAAQVPADDEFTKWLNANNL